MRILALASGVAALALAGPAVAQKSGHGGGHGGGKPAKVERGGGGGGQARAERRTELAGDVDEQPQG